MCVDASVVISFVLMSLLYVVPFFFIHALAKNLEQYFRVRSKLFFIGAAFALISFVLLFIDSAINPASLALGSDFYLSYLNLAGAFFSVMTSFCFYILTGSIKKAMNMRQRETSSEIFFLFVFFAIYYIMSLASMEQGTALSMSLNFVFSIAAFLMLFLSFLDLSDIYGALCPWCRIPALVASYLTLWNAFYQTFAFFNFIIPVEAVNVLYNVQTVITVTIIVLLTLPSWNMSRNLKVRVKSEEDEVSIFLSRMSDIIGGSTMTILKRAIEEYNSREGTTISYDPENGLSNGTADFAEFVVSYFEKLIGPVARRIFEESGINTEPEQRRNASKSP